ncbi:MAG: thioredoxin [Clostridia bacterium]|nr:thioredoxin [Clostridia bacterium]
MSVLKLNNENFEEVVAAKALTLVDFYADWCGPCKMVAPIVAEIAEEHPEITVGKVNVDESPALAARFGIMSIPTLVVLQNGEEANRVVGYRPKAELLELL